jgi:hypothetical protein
VSLAEIWEELERAMPPGESGQVKRRIRPEAKCDLFLAISKPSNLRMLVMLVGEDSLVGVEDLPTARGVEARITRPGQDGAHAALEVVLTDPRSADIFTALASDIAQSVVAESDDASAVATLVGRLRRWQRFLEESGPEGLTSERQRGLYAELWLLRQHLLEAVGPAAAVQGWTGPTRESHDFQFGASALEVKSSAGKQHQVLRVASERQLDDTGVQALFLFHLSLDAHQHAGESLPALVADLRESLRMTATAAAFEDRLFQVGYLDVHEHLYENPGYTVRESNFFQVTDGFPRIIEADLPPGVGDVHYSVAVAQCKHFLIDSETVITALRSSRANS